MKFNLREFKKIGSDQQKIRMSHPDGHEITLDKTKLHPKIKGEIEAMPIHAAAGVAIEESQPEAPQQPTNPLVPEDQVQKEMIRLGVNAGLPITMTGENPTGVDLSKFRTQAETNVAAQGLHAQDLQAKEQQRAYQTHLMDIQGQNKIRAQAGLPLLDEPPTPPGMMAQPTGVDQARQLMDQGSLGVQRVGFDQNNPDPYGYGAEMSALQHGYGQQMQGIKGEATAQGALGQAEAQQYQQGVNREQALLADHQKNFQDIENERQGLMRDAMEGHIDPNKFWEDRSLPGKVSTAIGLILGGIGGGLLHQENPALKFLQTQIDRNIDAQKLNISNKFSLLNANRQTFQNERDAVDMTRVMQSDLLANQIRMQAAKSQDPIVQARAQQAAGALQMQYAPLAQSLALRKTMMNGLNNGNLSPAQYIQNIRLMRPDVTPEQQTMATKELGNFQENEALRHDFQSSFDDLNNKALHGAFSPNDRQSAINAFAGRIAKVGEGRFNLEEAKLQAQALLPSPTDSPSTVQNKRQRMHQFFDSLAMTPTIDGLGIRLPKSKAGLERPPNFVTEPQQRMMRGR